MHVKINNFSWVYSAYYKVTQVYSKACEVPALFVESFTERDRLSPVCGVEIIGTLSSNLGVASVEFLCPSP